MRKHPTMSVQVTKAGTATMLLERPDAPAQRWRTGVATPEEALHRCQVVAGLCGYHVDRKVRYP